MTSQIPPSPGNLPAEPNTFIGRERDLSELADLLGEVRALTLCGPGGIGKTRLALRLAASLAPGYADGAWLVDLADADGPWLLTPLVAATLGIIAEPDHPLADTLTEALRSRSMLLILDTCEHLIEACAALVRDLLASCPGLRVVCTSREPLRIRGEVTWRVAPLGLPPEHAQAGHSGNGAPGPAEAAGSEAVRLFTERAAAARPGFRADDAAVAAVERICRTLDGIPLAIELAAARMRALSAEQLADRLDDRFALLLGGGDRTAPARHLTLRAAVAWSYDLLTPDEQVLLRRLSVFSGWTLEMAEQVCGRPPLSAEQVLDLLTALVDKSLAIFEGEVYGEARYRLLDTVRQFAAERADEAGETGWLGVAHRDCVLAKQERGIMRAFAPADIPWSQRMSAYHRGLNEQANTRAALLLCAERGDAEAGLRLCIGMRPIWTTGGDATDGPAMLDRLLAIDADVAALIRVRALSLRAELAFYQQDFAAAERFAQQGAQISTAELGRPDAAALRLLSVAALLAGRVNEAIELADAAVGAARAADDEWETGVALSVRASAIGLQGRLDDAQHGFERALGMMAHGRAWPRAQAMLGLGRLASARGDPASARRYYGQALVIYREIGARQDAAHCLALIGWAALSEHNLALARASLTESLELSAATGQRLAVARSLDAHAALAAASGDPATALRLAGASQALCEAVGATSSGGARKRLAELMADAERQLGTDAAHALIEEGRAMSAGAAVRLATAPAGLPRWPGRRRAPAEPGSGRSAAAAGSGTETGQPVLEPLTGREREVAICIWEGLTNAAIADRLSITPATAARHVANILLKLGMRSRAQIAAWVAERMPRQR